MSTTTTSDRAGVLRASGVVGSGSGVLFAAMTLWERAADPSGLAGAVNQLGFVLAMAGYVVLGIGLAMAGPGRATRPFAVVLAVAWTTLIAASALEAFTTVDPDTNLLDPLGGLLQLAGLLGFGIATAVAGRWSGWRRYAGSVLAVFYAGALFVPAGFGVEPSALVEVGWALGYAALGLALAVEAGWSARRSAARAGA